MRIALIISGGMWWLIYSCACTIRIDHPFYAPSTLDVNKSTSTGANNYVKKAEVKTANN